jgi:hypothetical protein
MGFTIVEKPSFTDYYEVMKELAECYDTLGFLRVQELEKKAEVWQRDPNTSIQTRDRTASYAAATITAEILETEARVQSLNVARAYIERYLNGP